MITTQIEIARSPEEVKKIFLDFPSYNLWHQGLYKSITPLSPTSPLSKNSKLHCVLHDDFTFDGVITENSPTLFQWQGPPVKGVTALHSFAFEESKTTHGGTTFRQYEVFFGVPAFLLHPWLLGRSLKAQFEGFNRDLKARAESLGS